MFHETKAPALPLTGLLWLLINRQIRNILSVHDIIYGTTIVFHAWFCINHEP
jgi:hypothetical protein